MDIVGIRWQTFRKGRGYTGFLRLPLAKRIYQRPIAQLALHFSLHRHASLKLSQCSYTANSFYLCQNFTRFIPTATAFQGLAARTTNIV
jgi:hypothetical protein